MAATALIGHTGFVGGTLLRRMRFDQTFNSSTIEGIRGQHFDRIICAGVPAVKWLANKEPEADRAGIGRLTDSLQHTEATHFILISTVDVYRDPSGMTERDPPPTEGLHPYGMHRLALEEFVARRFPSSTIIRLPALFGTGLKKNALYDLMHGNMVEKIVPNAAFQWYPMRRLAADLATIVDAGIGLINVTAEPVTMESIRSRFFADVPIGPPAATPPRYDVRSVHDALLGGHGGYHLNARAVFEELAVFLAEPAA